MSTYPVVALERDQYPTVQASGAVTGPGAGVLIATVTIPRIGLWEITVERFLTGTGQGIADTDNMEIKQNSTVVLAPLLVPPSSNSNPFEDQFILKCAAGDAITINAIGAATGTVIYCVTIIGRLVNANVF